MHSPRPATQTAAAPASEGRFNIYALIHKSIRLFMCDTLNAVGNMDTGDAASVSCVLAQVRALADHCLAHLAHENEFVHSAMEARRPGSSQKAVQDHEHHCLAVSQLKTLADSVEESSGFARKHAADRLYSYLAVFIAENFVHMDFEESEHNDVLWATHTDAELLAIEHAIVASLPAQESMTSMRWMLPALAHMERVDLLAGMRVHAPAPVFDAVMALGAQYLSAAEFTKLQNALEEPEAIAA